MGVRVVFPDMGKDPSVQLIEKTITENGTYDAITDGANGYSKVNVNVEGGGGESDFSTANVDVTVNGVTDELFYISNAVYIEDEKMYLVSGFTTGTYTLVLYKGRFQGGVSQSEGYVIAGVTGTGGVTVSDSPFGKNVNITGDGTLTVTIGRK